MNGKRRIQLLLLVAVMFVTTVMIAKKDEVKADLPESFQLVYDYVEGINRGAYEEIADLFTTDYAEMLKTFFNNEINKENRTGIFNISSIEVNDVLYVDDIEEYGNELDMGDYIDFDDVNVYLLNANIIAFEESDYYNTGVNNILFVTGIENDSYKIIQTIILPNADTLCSNQGIMQLDCDTPVATTDSVWKRPMYISVYRKELGVTQQIDFLYYCKVVTVCEVEEYANQPEAVKAVAVAIKNFAWKRKISPKYGRSELGCDVYDTTKDQVYNPTKYENDDETSRNVCVRAVLDTCSKD